MTVILCAALQLVAAHKVQQASLQLQRLGFAQWQAAAAVQAVGCALHPAVQWLLEGRVSSQSQAQQLLSQQGAHFICQRSPKCAPSVGDVKGTWFRRQTTRLFCPCTRSRRQPIVAVRGTGSVGPPWGQLLAFSTSIDDEHAAPLAVDVTNEAAQLAAALEALGVSQACVCQEVARHNGDVAAALSVLGHPTRSTSGGSGSSSGSTARQRHQRTFSPLQVPPQHPRVCYSLSSSYVRSHCGS